jgi:hypothetical protein
MMMAKMTKMANANVQIACASIMLPRVWSGTLRSTSKKTLAAPEEA